MKKLILLLLLLTAIILPSFSNGTVEQKETQKPIIAVSIIPLQTFAEKIVQDKTQLFTAIPKGSSPENYELTLKERAQLDKADIYFKIGVPTEELTIIPYLNEKTKLVDLSKYSNDMYPDIQIGDERDPHIWMSLKRAKIIVKTMAEKIAEIDPENSQFYLDNAQSYIKEIEKTNEKINNELADLKNRTFIIFHPALGYFAEDFNLTQIPLQREGKEATAKYLSEVLTFAKENGIKNIYYQAEISSKQSETFAMELGGKTIQVDPLSPDYLNNIEKIAQTFKDTFDE